MVQRARAVFITGGTSGIGRALARAYLDRGDVVGICARRAERFGEAFSDAPARLHFYRADVRRADEIRRAVHSFTQDFGLDIIIANAGVATPEFFGLPDFDKAREVFDINQGGVLRTFEAALPHFVREGRGRLVAVSSVGGLVGNPGNAAYSGSKAAVLKYCESLAMDLAHHHITVTCIAPAFVESDITARNDFYMPFFMRAEDAAPGIIRAIERGRVLYVFPWPYRIAMWAAMMLPRRWYVWLMRGAAKKLVLQSTNNSATSALPAASADPARD